jgi:hypothetical protein
MIGSALRSHQLPDNSCAEVDGMGREATTGSGDDRVAGRSDLAN